MKKYLISFCLILFAITTWAQTRVITGQILGAQKDTLIGAVVFQKGIKDASKATNTDIDGNFSISVEGEDVVLVVSYPGFEDQEIKVGSKNSINITMKEMAAEEEVIVIGYGTIQKSNQISNSTHLKKEVVTAVVGGNVLDNIQGKAAGLDITTPSGETGKSPQVTINGNRSISAANGPLYVVDGVQYSNIQDINPNDIQSMEVLKDAASTAIYGSRGANGVIIVTTKKGLSGTPKVSLNTYTGVSDVLAYPKAMTGQQWADLRLEGYRASSGDPTPTYQEALGGQDYSNLVNGVNTDYRKALLNKGIQRDIQVAVSGGNDKIKTYFSLDYYNEKGLLKKDELKRYTGRLNLDYQVAKFLRVGTQTQVTFYDQSKRVNPLGAAAKINPLTTPYNPDGSINIKPGGITANPLLDEQPNRAVDQLNTVRIFPTIYAEVKPFEKGVLKSLTGRSNLAVNWDNRDEGIFNAVQSFTQVNGGFNTANASHDATQKLQLNWQGIVNYNTMIKKNHSIGATLLSEFISNKSETFHEEANGQLIPAQLYYNLGDNTSRITTSLYTKSVLVSYAARLNYAYKGRYLMTVTGRTDGASVLAPGHHWDFFPSVAGGWKIKEEKFMDSLEFISTAKLRGSWGIAGNANIDPYSTQSVLTRIPFSYDETGVTAYTFKPQIGNTATQWEKSHTVNLGLDLGFLKDRFIATIDAYTTHTTDLLLTKRLPLSTGVVQTVANTGETQNMGWNVSATTVNIQSVKRDGTKRKSGFSWTTTLTFMQNREKVLQLADGLSTMQIIAPDGSSKMVVVGSPVNSFYDYQKIGIWQTADADAIAAYNAANPTATVKPGNIKIKDQNGDGVINTADRTVVGSTVPKWSGGFNSEFKFYNFDVSFFLYVRYGSTINYQYTYSQNGAENSLSTREYWTPENPSNDLPRPGYTIPAQFAGTLRYEDGSFLKLRSATIGYTMPSAISKKVGMSRLRFYVSGKNLLVFSKIKDYDPEMAGSLTFPTVRLVVGGLNVEF